MGSSEVDVVIGDVGSGLDDVHIEEEPSATQDDNQLAFRGMVLLLNNKWDESRELFDKYKSQSVIMHFGGSFVNYLQCKLFMIERRRVCASGKNPV